MYIICTGSCHNLLFWRKSVGPSYGFTEAIGLATLSKYAFRAIDSGNKKQQSVNIYHSTITANILYNLLYSLFAFLRPRLKSRVVTYTLLTSSRMFKDNKGTGVIHPLDAVTSTHILVFVENLVEIVCLKSRREAEYIKNTCRPFIRI